MASSSPATPAAKKTIVFSPAAIKKIGLDKLIKVPAPVAKTDVPAEEKSDPETATDHVEEDEVKPVEEVKEAKDEEEPVSPKSKNIFCNNLKMKMAQVLQDKKITIVAKTKAQELVIIKRPSTEMGEGKKIKVMQNKIVQAATKSDEDTLNGKTTTVVVKAKTAQKKKAPVHDDDEDEILSPVFKAKPMKTYKRKRSDIDDGVASKLDSPKMTKVEESDDESKSTGTKVADERTAKSAPVLIPKKRGRKSKAELAEIARQAEIDKEEDDDDDVMEIKLLDADHDDENEDDSDTEEIIIVKVPKTDGAEGEKYDAENDEEEIHFITDKRTEDSEGEEEGAPKPKQSSQVDKKTTEELVKAIKKKRGRRSKAELEILKRWERMERGVDESEEEEEDEEQEEEVVEEEEDEEEEISMIIMSPTRTGRVPKRNKIFDNYVTTSRSRKQSSDTESTPKPAPSAAKSDGPTPKRGRGRGRPPKNKLVETPKAEKPIEEKKEDKVTVVQNENAEAVHVTGDDEVIVIPKKRGRTFVQSVEVTEPAKDSDDSSKTSTSEEGKDKEIKDDKVTAMEVDEIDQDKEEDTVKVIATDAKVKKVVTESEDISDADEDVTKTQETESKTTDTEAKQDVSSNSEKIDDEASSTNTEKENTESKVAAKLKGTNDEPKADTTKEVSAPEESISDADKKTESDEIKDKSATSAVAENAKDKQSADGGEKKTDQAEQSIANDANDAKADGDAEVVAVRRKGRQLMHKVNIRTAMKRKLEVEESPSTSGDGGVDEPSKKRKLDASNVPVADLNVKRPHGEGPSARMYKLLVANLVVRIRQEMAAAQDQPKKPGATVTCAICKINCKPTQWAPHKQRWHNNLAWRTTDEPLDLDDYLVVQNILVKLYPKKPCICNDCGDAKKSALGFLTHKLCCKRTDEEIDALVVPCDICGELMLPYRLFEHDKAHKKMRIEAENKVRRAEMKRIEVVDDDGTPRKRQAAKRASEIISQVSTELASESSCSEIKYKIMKKFYVKHYYQHIVKGKIRSLIEEKGEIACLFQCERIFEDIYTLYEHLPICDERPFKYFMCKLCLGVFEILASFRKHLYEDHLEQVQKVEDGVDSFVLGDTRDEEDAEDMDYADMEHYSYQQHRRPGTPSSGRIYLNAYWKISKFAMLSRHIYPSHCPKAVPPMIYAQMLKFCEMNYKKDLFSTYPFKKSMWYPVNKNYITQYLPRMKVSIAVGFTRSKTSDITYKRYKLFEATLNDGTANIYCGGPITAMAWAPTDHNQVECEQILAVAVQQDPDAIYSFKRNDLGYSIIQFWNFGVLHNKSELTRAPELDVVIAHQHGGIFSMEWCPSGCFEVTGTRLGLLAVCSTDGNVYCYSVGKSNLLSEKMFKPKPVFKLVASIECDNKLGMRNYYPTKLSWTKAEGHKYIAVAYSNGLVGMFNIQSKNDVFRQVDEVFYPYLTFKADFREITAISLNHLDGGNRFVLTGSGTRDLKLWDLRLQTLKPNQFVKRSCHHEIYWPVNGLTCMSSNDDTSSNAHLSVPSVHLIDYDFVRPTTLVYSQAAQRCISGSDWGGAIYLATEGGEVSCATYRDLYPFVQEVPSRKYMLSAANVLFEENTSISIKDRNNFKVLQKTHKVLFHDANMSTLQSLKNAREEQNANLPDFSKFPLQAATATCNNSNRFSFLFTAVGYNIGFVRVFHSNFLNLGKPV